MYAEHQNTLPEGVGVAALLVMLFAGVLSGAVLVGLAWWLF